MGLKVIAKTEGFRRCGIAFSADAENPTEVKDGQLTKEQFDRIDADPYLKIVEGKKGYKVKGVKKETAAEKKAREEAEAAAEAEAKAKEEAEANS
jgi:hypothetical protein